jgi:uncharacterized protein (UPF0332 family)
LATWKELSIDSLLAARRLATDGHLRSSISRAYYAAYCAIAGELAAQGLSFPYGWNNPSHEPLPDLVSHNLPLPLSTRHRLSRKIRLLRRAREDADYRPGTTVDRALTLQCLRDARTVLMELQVSDE